MSSASSSSTNPSKLSRFYIFSLIYRKHSRILNFLSIIGILILLFNSQVFQNSINLNISYYDAKKVLSFPLMGSQSVNALTGSEVELTFQEKLKGLLKCHDIPLRTDLVAYGKYWLVKNYIRGLKSSTIGCAESITYTTTSDYTYMEHLPRLVERWLAPISYTLYAPGDDYYPTMDSIQYVRNCLPESHLIRDYVTFHIFFPRHHLPDFIATNEEEALQWPYDCNVTTPPYMNVSRSEMYKTFYELSYPINVGRNIARKSANTHFILPSDIDLYPSKNLVNQFLEMVAKNPVDILNREKLKVFALPIFEIASNASIPDNKEELKKMLNDSTATPFRKHVCLECHKVPQQESWLNSSYSEEMSVFTVGKLYYPHRYWDPIYISDNREPIFDERVTWEGQSNRRIQNYAMCLLDYEYHVLHPAFLVHTPGIKTLTLEMFMEKNPDVAKMSKFINRKIVPEYASLYGTNKHCKV